MENMKFKYVILRTIETGECFFTTFNDSKDEVIKLNDGTIAYQIIGFGNTVEECQNKLGYKTCK